MAGPVPWPAWCHGRPGAMAGPVPWPAWYHGRPGAVQFHPPAHGLFFTAATVVMSFLFMPLVRAAFQLLSCRCDIYVHITRYTHIYMYIRICVSVRVCVCVYVHTFLWALVPAEYRMRTKTTFQLHKPVCIPTDRGSHHAFGSHECGVPVEYRYHLRLRCDLSSGGAGRWMQRARRRARAGVPARRPLARVLRRRAHAVGEFSWGSQRVLTGTPGSSLPWPFATAARTCRNFTGLWKLNHGNPSCTL
jgi:hypothetical protein